MRKYSIGEISCPALYFPQASSINFRRSLKYGFGVTKTAFDLVLARKGIWTPEYLRGSGELRDMHRAP